MKSLALVAASFVTSWLLFVATLAVLELSLPRELVVPPPGASMRCLGKLEPKLDARTALFRQFVEDLALVLGPRADSADALPAPEPFDWATGLPEDLGMMRNDRINLCTVAACAHLIQLQTAANGAMVTICDDDVQAAYAAITASVNGRGYSAEDPTTDTGLALLDVLKWVRANGLGPDQHGKGLAFLKVCHDDPREMQIAGRLFGGTLVGAALPIAAEAQLELGQAWTPTDDADGAPASLGRHAMAMHAASSSSSSYITWGKRRPASSAWNAKYVDEMYAFVSPDWVNGTRPAPSGFSIDKLRAYLSEL
jgi:hypothetical protein